MKLNALDLIGQRIGKLLVVAKLDTTPSGARWLCECDCGEMISKITTQLRRKRGDACGCRACEAAARSAGRKHGGASKREPLYRVWKEMRHRCSDPSNPYYGGKGISVCPEWQEYQPFRAWALFNGYEHRPDVTRGDRLSIERINPAVGYCPENCEWITGRENSRRMARKEQAHG